MSVTEELIRKKAEHNECIIATLEELSLHQENVEKIEHINNWCKKLEILYLQANIISTIENLNKLKNLQYLNLAVNNIEKIENLERCESLTKLDLTLNFIGDLESVKSLKSNLNLRELYLTGNPCCDFEGYREYVISVLPQVTSLDVKDVTKSERIKAFQLFETTELKIKKAQEKYVIFREEQKNRVASSNYKNLSDDEFWKSSSENCPETRVEMAVRQEKSKETSKEEPKETKKRSLFAKDGRPLNINQANLKFSFNDDDNPNEFKLDLAIYRYLDTNLIDVDLQPIYAKVSIKGKIFQIVFPEEIKVDKSKAQRSQITGHLVISMPKANYKEVIRRNKKNKEEGPSEVKKKELEQKRNREYLEVIEKEKIELDKIVSKNENSDIPPLEYS